MKTQLKSILMYLAIILLFGNIQSIYPDVRHHEIGKLWDSMEERGFYNYEIFYHGLTWPGGDYRGFDNVCLLSRGLWIGVRNWTAHDGQAHNFYVSEGGPGPIGLQSTVGISIKKYIRESFPTVTVNGKEEDRLTDEYDRRNSSLPCDEMVETVWNTDVGITVNRRSYVFSHQEFDDFIILEYLLINTGNIDRTDTPEMPGQVLEDMYFGFIHHFRPCRKGSQNANTNNDRDADDWIHYYGNETGDTLRGLWYCYDGDSKDPNSLEDDTGDPHTTNTNLPKNDPNNHGTGEFLSPQFAGFGVIHADVSARDHSDDPNQPASAFFQPHNQKDLPMTRETTGMQPMYEALATGTFQQGTDVLGFADASTPEIASPYCFISFGPYQMNYGDSVRIVIYGAVNGLSRRKCIEYGHAWKVDSLEFDGLAGDAAKNALIATGKDSLFATAKRAEWLWDKVTGWDGNWDSEKKAIAKSILPPFSPSYSIFTNPGNIEIDWTKSAGKITRKSDFLGWRLYRAEGSHRNLYELLTEFRKPDAADTTTLPEIYQDSSVVTGRYYYYAVTSFTDGSSTTGFDVPRSGLPIESSSYINRNWVYPAYSIAAAKTQLNQVYVVPNPYHLYGYHWDNATEIRFVGLTEKATIRIFTLSGDLIRVLEHPDPRQGEFKSPPDFITWNLRTNDNRVVTSGTYCYHIQGFDQNGNAIGTTNGMFVVIR
ncbi:hypothetical protein JXJ21_08840 [candidate division KSB1 bacterium]|nr:hypothetical protein [candidate division KSB1 bacterium]